MKEGGRKKITHTSPSQSTSDSILVYLLKFVWYILAFVFISTVDSSCTQGLGYQEKCLWRETAKMPMKPAKLLPNGFLYTGSSWLAFKMHVAWKLHILSCQSVMIIQGEMLSGELGPEAVPPRVSPPTPHSVNGKLSLNQRNCLHSLNNFFLFPFYLFIY